MDVYNRKIPAGFFRVEQFVLAATPFFAYRNLLSQLLKVVHKMTRIIDLVGTQAISKFLSYYLFELLSKKTFIHLAIRVINSK